MEQYWILFGVMSLIQQCHVSASSKEEAVKEFRKQRGDLPHIIKVEKCTTSEKK